MEYGFNFSYAYIVVLIYSDHRILNQLLRFDATFNFHRNNLEGQKGDEINIILRTFYSYPIQRARYKIM